MSDSVRPQRRQPTRLPRPWDSPGKNTGVGCHFLLQCMKVESESEVAQSCPTPSDPMDCSPPGSSIHGICQARVVEWVCCFMSSSNCCFLTCIQVSQEAGKVVWYSHLFKSFPQFIVIHTVKSFSVVNEAYTSILKKERKTKKRRSTR